MPVYTVGHEETYDIRLAIHGDGFVKKGASDNYVGGFACQTVPAARLLIREFGKEGEWAVYELEADWNKDAVPSNNGWWYALRNDSVVIRKVS